jgi:3-hydroxymyristoyl/3-hydroxydecanoyl-(acyl carrier protein) dehydratase
MNLIDDVKNQQYLKMMICRDYPLDRIANKEVDRICVERFISFRDAVFAEHFPEHAVLPGSYLIATAVAGAEKLFDCELGYSVEIKRVKFLRPVEPGDILLVCVWRVQGNIADVKRSQFRFSASTRHDSRNFAEGLMVLVKRDQV